MRSTDNITRRFAIALSFPGQHRRFVRNVAVRLAEELTKERVFFDEWYEPELQGTDTDLKLKQIYRDDSELVVPFFSEHYMKMWCQIEWRAIRVVLAERAKDDAVLPIHIDGTRVEGWEVIDLGIHKGRKSGREVADAIMDVHKQRQQVAGKVVPYGLVHPGANPLPHRPLLQILERACADGDLRNSLLAPIVISVLSAETELKLVRPMDPDLVVRSVRLSDEYFVPVRKSAGQRDYQRDFPQSATPILVSIARSFERSADAHAVIVQLCNALADRLRMKLIWPDDPDEFNDLTNEIYSACLQATHLDDDDVLMALKGLPVVGPN